MRSNTVAGCPERHTLDTLATFDIRVQILSRTLTEIDKCQQKHCKNMQKQREKQTNKATVIADSAPAPALLQTPPPHQSSLGVVVVLNRMQPKTRSRGVSPFITRQRHLPSSGLLCEK